MELNHIFLFVAVVSPVLVLARAWRPGGTHRGWRVSAILVLAITAASWFLVRDVAGYIGGAAWAALLFIPAIGLRKVTELFEERRYKAARRLAFTLQLFHPTAELRRQIKMLRLLELQQNATRESRAPSSAAASRNWYRPLRAAPVVSLLIATNIFAFAIEIARRSLSDPNGLHRLGALDPYSVVIDHQYWRLLTALFLHYGIVHLLFNLFALYVLGPALERTIGSVRFALCYFISGLGSTSGVILLTLIHLIRPGEVVGASGCIMGVVGAWAGFLIRHREAPQARQRLMNILLIVVVQTAFDLATPQVSLAAHVCGLISGLVVGILTAPKW